MDWYLNLEAGMLFPVDPYYTEMYYIDFDESFSAYALNYVNNADEKQALELFETREDALVMLIVIAKKLGAVNYTEKEEVAIDWDKLFPEVIPYPVPDINPPIAPPYYDYGPIIVTCNMEAPNSNLVWYEFTKPRWDGSTVINYHNNKDLVWYESKGELCPIK